MLFIDWYSYFNFCINPLLIHEYAYFPADKHNGICRPGTKTRKRRTRPLSLWAHPALSWKNIIKRWGPIRIHFLSAILPHFLSAILTHFLSAILLHWTPSLIFHNASFCNREWIYECVYVLNKYFRLCFSDLSKKGFIEHVLNCLESLNFWILFQNCVGLQKKKWFIEWKDFFLFKYAEIPLCMKTPAFQTEKKIYVTTLILFDDLDLWLWPTP